MFTKNMRAITFVLATSLFFLSGCVTRVPFREQVPLGIPDASRITISAEREPLALTNSRVVYGRVYVNGIDYGDFTDEKPVFSIEVTPGDKLIVVCPGNDNRCISAQVKILPNKNHYYQYTFESVYKVIAASLVWRLVPTKIDDYRPSNLINSTSNSPQNSNKNSSETSTEKNMEGAKRKCVDLGFKINTQSFGDCVLKLAR